MKVPNEFTALFDVAESLVSSYFAQKTERPEQGHIEINGERYILVRASSLSVDFYDMMRGLYQGRDEQAMKVARNLLFNLAHFVGRSDAEAFHTELGLKDPIERLSAGPVHFSHTGWAFVDILPESHPVPNDDYCLVYDHPYSFESNCWRKAGRISAQPVCFMSAGYSSGWCEASFGMPLVAAEILCVARGDPCCRFIMGPPSRIMSLVEQYLEGHPEVAAMVGHYEVPGEFDSVELEGRLRVSEARFQQLFENTLDAVLILQEERIVHFNQRAGGLFCCQPADLHGRTLVDLSPMLQEDGKNSLTAMADYQARAALNEPQLFRWRLLTAKGGILETEISLGRLEGSEGTIQASIRDITERVRAAEERRRLEQEMRQLQKMEELGTLAGGVAHDFNNLLAVVGGNLELIQESLHNRPQDLVRLKRVQTATDRARDIVRQLLTFARGAQNVEQTIDLRGVVRENVDLLAQTVDPRIEIDVVCAQEHMVLGDPTYLAQVLVNLLLNARDALADKIDTPNFMPRITVELEEVASPHPSAQSPGPFVRMVVADNGQGMDPDVQTRAFEPFFTTKGAGSGLGLSTVFGIVHQSGGWVDLESEPGLGTRISVFFRQGTTIMPVEAPQTFDESPTKAATVLVVEDEADLSEMVQEILEMAGHTVFVARDGEAGLTTYLREKERIDLVLLDLTMPLLSGRALLRRILEDNAEQSVVAMSGYSTEVNAREVLALGAREFLAKPFNKKELLAALKRSMAK